MEYRLRERFGELLKCGDKDEIEFYSVPSAYVNGDSTEGVQVIYRINNREGKEIGTLESKYQEDEWVPPLITKENSIDEKTAGYIVNMERMKNLGEQIGEGKQVNSEKIKDICIHALKRAKAYEELDLNRDDNGNITATKAKEDVQDNIK